MDDKKKVYNGCLRGIWYSKTAGRMSETITPVDKITSNGNTALHVAVGSSSNNHKFLEELLELTPLENTLLDMQNSDGSTPLHVAAIVSNTEAAKILLRRNRNLLFAKDKAGHTPLAISLSNMHFETSGDELLVLSISSKNRIFMGQWCDGNISTLIHVFECFYRASGLRINMRKSKILGVNVDSDKVKGVALKLGCLILKTPFTYVGSKVGGSMSRVHAWNEVVDRVKNRLSKWKMKTLSIGGRLTLLKSVLGSIPIFHLSIYRAPLSVLRTLESIRSKFFKGHDINSNKASWVNWKKVLASKEKGGLGVRVVKAIHGDDGNVGGHVKSGVKSCWLDIVRETHALKTKGYLD
ncbi:RNA-directed DNA polymerase, eukaryota, reverse transcriptase zinc-binding domain protein [Tanacetum coccineum]